MKMIVPPEPESDTFKKPNNTTLQSTLFDIYFDQLDLDNRTMKEVVLLIFIIRRFIREDERQPIRNFVPFVFNAGRDHIQFHPDRMRKRGTDKEYSYDRGSASTYEDVYHNQTIHFEYNSVSHIDKNNGRVKAMVDKFISEGIMKRLSKNKYLINPKYARNMKGSQATLMKQITDNEF